MNAFLSEIENRILKLLDDHPDGLEKHRIIQCLGNEVTVWDLQELLIKGFLEVKDGKLRVLGHSPLRR